MCIWLGEFQDLRHEQLSGRCSSENWDVLIDGDYRAVMPLPSRKKFGLRYVYTPAFVQQLGVFSSQRISSDLENKFYKRLTSGFVLADYALHSGSQPKKSWRKRVNYTLDLNRSSEDLIRAFNSNRKRIIRKGFSRFDLAKIT